MSAQRLLEAGGILGPLDKGSAHNLNDARLRPARKAQKVAPVMTPCEANLGIEKVAINLGELREAGEGELAAPH